MADQCQEYHQMLIDLAAVLRGRGIEATPSQVHEWAEKMVKRMADIKGVKTSYRQWVEAALSGQKMATMCLHLHFGDAR